MREIVIIGAGVVGTALGSLLARRGYRIRGIASRSLSSAERASAKIGGVPVYPSPWEAASQGEVVFITTPDRAIASVAQEVAERGSRFSLQTRNHFYKDLEFKLIRKQYCSKSQ